MDNNVLNVNISLPYYRNILVFPIYLSNNDNVVKNKPAHNNHFYV